jgi:hypothetical protein
MVEKYKDQPFALVGVNSDGERSAVQKILKEQGLMYRNACDGTTKGPIATAWNIHGWPTVFVIDAKGIIRAKFVGVDPKKLTVAIEDALKDAK